MSLIIESHQLAPTHIYEGYGLRAGNALPFGATVVPGGVNFSIVSAEATGCTLVLFHKGEAMPLVEIPLPPEYQAGHVFAVLVLDLNYEEIEYGFKLTGIELPRATYSPDTILLDPYAKAITGRGEWAVLPDWNDPYQHRARIPAPDLFDWGEDHPLNTPVEDLVIYEMHVRGFTQHPTSGVRYPGTYAGMMEKISYLKDLGINCVELMPIFEFDEFENCRENPETGELLLNYWGYSPVGFFAPKAGYAASGPEGGEINELKNLVKALHANGIEVILDVVFNHTAEGNHLGPVISFKGLDNDLYYILTPEGYYYNFSGTGNTFNCNHPVVRGLILESLRYWVTEYHVDGFRFDLASIMTRDSRGMPMEDPPILQLLALDPVLGKTKLIAEPWDADGLYHLGSFPDYGRWAEWNGYYRDTLRKFLKADSHQVQAMAQAVLGSPNLYPGRGPITSINFITAHDGFTLMDLVSYNDKHNENNFEGENGANDNHSWNCGAEGITDDPEINALRRRQVKNAIAMLMISQGVPMILMGDEVGRTQNGNNNTYCQDNDLNWLDWRLLQENADIFRFFKFCITFRHYHPILRNGYYMRHVDFMDTGYKDIVWHGRTLNKPDWTDESRTLAFMLDGGHAKGGLAVDNSLYIAMNMHWEGKTFDLPSLPTGVRWHVFVNTGDPFGEIRPPNNEPVLPHQRKLPLMPHSVAILIAK
jgi:isoamylase